MGQRVLSRQDAQNNDKCDLTSHWGDLQKPPISTYRLLCHSHISKRSGEP